MACNSDESGDLSSLTTLWALNLYIRCENNSPEALEEEGRLVVPVVTLEMVPDVIVAVSDDLE
eukprot:1361100-Amorphochlora_amoeboformis.AAC.1